eukprot:14755142-Alexandrium_andersonii.AAC.1
MDKAAAPTGPTRPNVLAKSLESAESGDPELSALHAEGAALRAAPSTPGDATEGVHAFCRFQALDKD